MAALPFFQPFRYLLREPNRLRARDTPAVPAACLLLLLFGTAPVADIFVVVSGSMEPTLLPGDHLLAERWSLSYQAIERGEIILFRFPPAPQEIYVKRVAGLPGDKIVIHDNRLYVNDELIEEPYLIHSPTVSPDAPPAIDPYQVEVPPGHYFVLGDNRNASFDSRYWGFVPHRSLAGRPVLIFWSANSEPHPESGVQSTAMRLRSWVASTRWNRIGLLVQPPETGFQHFKEAGGQPDFP